LYIACEVSPNKFQPDVTNKGTLLKEIRSVCASPRVVFTFSNVNDCTDHSDVVLKRRRSGSNVFTQFVVLRICVMSSSGF